MPRNRTFLKVNKSLCSGCGLCVRACPQGAINLVGGKAEIDASRCNSCYQCVDACHRGAISEMIAVSPRELKTTVSSLKQQTDDIIKRIDQLVGKT